MKVCKMVFFFCFLILSSSTRTQEASLPVEWSNKRLVKFLKKNSIDISKTGHTAVMDLGLPDGQVYALMDDFGRQKFLYIGRVFTCRSGGCGSGYFYSEDIKQDREYFDYAILFDEFSGIVALEVIDYRATHGHEVSSRGWLKQFQGYKAMKKLEVGKNIDGVSGATISVYSMVANIEYVTESLKDFQQSKD